MKELRKFIGNNKVYFLLLFISTGISFVSLFSQYKWITICGILFTLLLALFNKWKSYKHLQDFDKKISSYDEAFHTERDKDGSIKKITIDGGTF